MRAAAERVHPAVAATGEDRAERVRQLFGAIAPRYELVNRVASFGRDAAWRRETVKRLAVEPGDWCLDACCGTGDLARELAGCGVRVLGVDFCRPMIARGAARPGLGSTVAWAEGDALRLPAATGSMDAACVAFGLRNLADPAKGLAELARVVRPGGRVAVLEFSRPDGPVMRALYGAYSGVVLPFVGDVLTGRWGTYRYLPETIRAWFSRDELTGMMRAAGLRDVHAIPMTFGVVTLHVGVQGGAPRHGG